MKVKAIALAVAALSAGAANAYTDDATNLYITGASAVRANVGAAALKLCADAGGTMTLFKRGAGVSSINNQMIYSCSQPYAGTTITDIYHTTTGGSLTSVLGMSNDALKQLQPANKTCDAALPGTGALAAFTSVRANCGQDVVAKSDGGFSDLEYKPVREQVDILTGATDGFTVDDLTEAYTGVAQAFGIMVSEKMYKDLQIAQGKVTGCTIPARASCTDVNWGSPLPAFQPTLTKADITAMINNNVATPHKKGAEAIGLLTGASVEYARRVTTSGTQSSAQVHFLGKGCLSGENGGEFVVIGDSIAAGGSASFNLGKFIVSAHSGTSDVTARLTALGDTAYGFGVVSAENRSGTGATGNKYIKLNDVAISDGTSSGKNRQNAIDGKYDFWFELVSYKEEISGTNTDADEAAVIDAISTAMGTPESVAGGASTVGLFLIGQNPGGFTNATKPTEVSKYQRGGSLPNSCQPVSRQQ